MEQDNDNREAFDREIEALSDLIKGMIAFQKIDRFDIDAVL